LITMGVAKNAKTAEVSHGSKNRFRKLSILEKSYQQDYFNYGNCCYAGYYQS
jgi:hypothetical protein